MKQNSNRLKAIAEFIYRNFPFVVHIAFMQMETIGLARENINKVWVDPHDYVQDLEDAVMHLAMRDMNVSVYNSQLCILPKSIWKFSKKSISTWKNIYLDECQGCTNMNECGGFFSSSSEIHSAYIKAMKIENNKLKQPKKNNSSLINFKAESSPTLLKFIDYIANIKNYPILDVPCGFGRHSFLLASLGCKVICADINKKALNHIAEVSKNLEKYQLNTLEIDLTKTKWSFDKDSIGAIINIHYYQYNLLDKFIYSIVPGGYLYLETPAGHGGNYVDLPIEDSIRDKLEPYFNIIYYAEKIAGPLDSNRVTVKLFAQKLKA